MHVDLEVVTGRGTPRALRLDVASVDEAHTHAARQGYTILSARARESASWRGGVTSPRRRSTIETVVFVEQLRDLLGAGLSVIEALETLSRGSSGAGAAALEELGRSLREGKPLSEALAQSGAFPELLVALVRASELTSDLPRTLTRFLDHEARVAMVRDRLVSAAIYPLLLVGVGGLVLLFLLFYVMPRFARVFEGVSGELPWSARAILGWAEVVRAGGFGWLIGGALFFLAVVGTVATPRWRAASLRRLMEGRLLRSRLRTYYLARWFRAVGMLVEGGIPLASALALANVLLPSALRTSGDAAEQGVRQGLSPSRAYMSAGMATPVAEQLLVAGERSGDLGAVLGRIAHFHEAEAGRALERSMRALEPLVMVLVGIGVGIVVVLMYLPIFELASAIQ